RVEAGAVAAKALAELGVTVSAYVKSIGPVEIDYERFDPTEARNNPVSMPDPVAAQAAMEYLDECRAKQDSSGGVVECVIHGVPAGVGDPCFEKLNARLAQAVCSIGAVKGFEIGDGFAVAKALGSENNDAFALDTNGKIAKKSNHAGGILGGISDGSDIMLRAAFKPTPSISSMQQTVNRSGEEISVSIRGRHDPIIVPRAAVVVEAMAALTVLDSMLVGMSARMDRIQEFYR
ncbi:MAG: chorismate synthase, partial [Lachnospiraceae bacterium]|nr:chorismate synthase [Lachnospiraceae bacterium]